MEKRKIIFRADGNAQIGLGHVMRCIALGQMISDDFELYFAIQNPSITIQELLETENFKVIDLPQTTDYEIDAENFTKILTGSEIVVLDGYNFKESYQRATKKASRKLVFIDDLAAWHQVADIVINHSGAIQVSDYQAESHTQFLLGTQYALLRKEFLNREPKVVVPNRYEKFLVNFGGADPINMTLKICEILLAQHLATKRKITVIVGSSYLYIDKLKALDTENKLTILSNLSAKEMVKTIESNQVVICSPSTIAYEVATLRKSMILIQTADNQKDFARFFKINQLALLVGKVNFSDNLLYFSLMTSLSDKKQKVLNQGKYFDGKSGERIRKVFQNL
jgi:UDP-2,4-diacetamido-2,4,6-trideoxy-beta-L-altropyranose hydrolase